MDKERYRISQQRSPKDNKTKRLACVTTYHPIAQIIHQVVRRNWHLLGQTFPKIEEFPSIPLTSFKKSPNFRDKLIKADIGSLKQNPRQSYLQTTKNFTFPCLACCQCSSVTRGEYITHPQTGKKYRINGYFTCNSSFIVYSLCGLAYVGETTQHMRDSMSKHKSTIHCQNLLLPIPSHF